MADQDYLFSVGVDTTKASTQIDNFVKATTIALNKIGTVTINVKGLQDVGKTLDANGQKASKWSKQVEMEEERILALRIKSERQRYEAVIRAEKEEEKLFALQRKAEAAVVSGAAKAEAAVAKQQRAVASAAAAKLRAENQSVAALVAAEKVEEKIFYWKQQQARAAEKQAIAPAKQNIYTGNPAAIRATGGAFDYFGKVMRNTMFHFIEYQVAMQAFEAVVHEFTNSLHEASNTNFEMAMQKLYAPTVNANDALKNATVIARAYGADIQDVQQVIGLWTKQTHDLGTATYLANEAEKLHRASGIETLEVYRTSIALSSQLGTKLKELPLFYNQVAAAAIKIAVPLKALGKSTEEGIKDIFQGVEKDAALLRSLGFELPQIIAINALQVQGLGEKGREAGTQLATMFAALATQGSGSGANMKGAGVFEKIIGKENIEKGGEALLKSFIDHTDKLEEAFKQSSLRVKSQQGETFRAFLEYAKKVKELSAEITSGQVQGKNATDVIAGASIVTFQGQMDRLKTSIQAISITIGNELLPGAIKFVQFMYASAIPTVEHWVPVLFSAAKAIAFLGASFLVFEGLRKISSLFVEFQAVQSAAMQAGFYNAAAMEREMLAADADAAALARVEKAKSVMVAVNARLVESSGVVSATLGTEAIATSGLVDAEGKAITSMEALPGKAAIAGRGLAGLGAAAMTAVMPFLLLTAAVGTAMAAADGFDKRKAVAASIATTIHDHDPKDNNLGGILRSIPTAVTAMSGDIVNPGAVDEAANNLAKVNSGQGRQMKAVLAREKELRRQRHNQSVDAGAFEDYSSVDGELDKTDLQKAKLLKNNMAYQDAHPNDPMLKQLDALMAGLKKQQAAMNYAAGEAGKTAPPYVDPGSNSHKGQVSPESAFQHAVATDKRDAQADINSHLDAARAAKEEATSEKTLAEAYEYTDAGLKRMHASHQTEIAEYGKSAAGALKEQKTLAATQTQYEKLIATHKETKAQLEQTKNALSFVRDATLKAGAAAGLYAEQSKAASASAAKDEAEYQTRLLLQQRGLDTVAGQVATIRADAAHSKGLFNELLGDESAIDKLNKLKASLQAVYDIVSKQFNGNTKVLGPIIAEFGTIDTAIDGFGSKIYDARQKITELGSTIRKELSGQAKSNFDGIAELLNVNKADVDYINTLANGWEKIAEERDKIAKQQVELDGALGAAKTDAERQAVENARQSLDLMRQQVDEEARLLPMLAEEKQRRDRIKESSLMGAADSALSKYGTSRINTQVSGLFGKGGQNGIKGLIQDFTKSVMDSWWQTTAKSITSSLFKTGEDPKMKAERAMFEKHVKDLKTVVDSHKPIIETFHTSVDKHFDAITHFGAYVDKFVASVPGGTGTTRGPQQADALYANYSITSPNADPNVVGDMTAAIAQNTEFSASIAADAAMGAQAPDGSSAQAAAAKLFGINIPAGLSGGLSAFNTPGSGAFSPNDNGSVNIGGVVTGIGTAASGFQQGGVMGGLETGLGTFEALSSAGVPTPVSIPIAGAAALATALVHHDNTADMPDKYDTQKYGQFTTDMNGIEGNFNGTYIDPETQFDPLLGNQDLADKAAGWVNDPGMYATLQPNQKALFDSVRGLEDSSGGGLGIKSEKDDVYTLDSGKTVNVEQYEQMIGELQKIEQNTAQAIAPLISISAFGASGASPYNTPGLNASEFQAMQQSQTKFQYWNASNPGQASGPFATPGVGPGGNNPGVPNVTPTNPAQQTINLVTQLLVDSQVLASAVNSVNTQTAMRYGN